MNEATFESHLANTLKRLFPTPFANGIEIQKEFTLRLGHSAIRMNGVASLARGRADLIIRTADQRSILLELKGPGIVLTDADIRQGLSYARLHEPLIPIVVVTNGEDTRFFATFDGSTLEGNTLDEQRLVALISAGAKQAAETREETIRSLIGGNPEIWASALRTESMRVLHELEGSLTDLTRPLCEAFRLPRRATAILAGAFDIEKQRALALVGPPLSGKTNVIAELCRRSEEFHIAPLYVDCLEASDLLEEISRALTDSLGASIPRDQVHDWLRLGIGDRANQIRLVLILDSLFPADSRELIQQATQLLTSAGVNFSVLYSLTDADWDRVQNVPGRLTLSKLGRDVKPLFLRELEDDEIDTARSNLKSQLRLLLPDAYQFELTMRQPHTLRLIVAMEDSLHEVPEGMVSPLPPIIPTGFLRSLWNRTQTTPELRADLQALSRAYIKDEPSRQKNARLAAVGMSVGAMTLETVEAVLSGPAFSRLLAQGHIKRVTAAEMIVVVPTLPELLSAACVSSLTEGLLSVWRSDGVPAAKDWLLRMTRGLGLGDRVAALVLESLVAGSAELLMALLNLLLEDEPHEEIKESGNFLMQTPGGDAIELIYDGSTMRLKFPEGTEKVIDWPEEEGAMRMMTGVHSWNILSHVAYSGIALKGNDDIYPLGPSIIRQVGKIRATLRDIGRSSFVHTNSVYEHSLPGYGTVPCPGRGIVEPITYAIQINIQQFGALMDNLVDESIAERDPALLMRLYVAAKTLIGIQEPEVNERALKMEQKLSVALDEVFEVIHDVEH